MNNPLRKIFKGDTIIWTVFVVLILLSVLQVFSAISYLAYRSSSYVSPIQQHIRYLIIGIIITFLFERQMVSTDNKVFPITLLFRIVRLVGFVAVCAYKRADWRCCTFFGVGSYIVSAVGIGQVLFDYNRGGYA